METSHNIDIYTGLTGFLFLLDEYGLPSKYIHVVDKLKQSRKKGGKR
jgi:hypothetical protein